MPFKKLALAINLSPTGKRLLQEAKRLQSLLNAELILIHVGNKDEVKQEKLHKIMSECGVDTGSTKLVWQEGDPAKVIMKTAEEESADLLISGALEKESSFKYFLGSVARRIMRESACSVLILTTAHEWENGFKKFAVSTDFSSRSETAILKAHKLALLESAEEFVVIREFQVPGLSITVSDSGSLKEVEAIKENWQKEEEDKLNVFIRELNLKEIPIKTVSLFGKEGWEANRYARENNSDIFVTAAPRRKPKFFDRIFIHSFEFVIKEISSSLLIIKD